MIQGDFLTPPPQKKSWPLLWTKSPSLLYITLFMIYHPHYDQNDPQLGEESNQLVASPKSGDAAGFLITVKWLSWGWRRLLGWLWRWLWGWICCSGDAMDLTRRQREQRKKEIRSKVGFIIMVAQQIPIGRHFRFFTIVFGFLCEFWD